MNRKKKKKKHRSNQIFSSHGKTTNKASLTTFSMQINLMSEAVSQRCSVEKVFLEILQNSHESTCTRVSFLIKLQAQGL